MHTGISRLLSLAAILGLLSACGGGGQGLRGAGNAQPISVNPVVPAAASADVIEYALPIEGGCGGPYTVELVGGALPEGIAIDDRQQDLDGPGNPPEHRHHLVGILLDDGNFDFTLNITDLGCTPFSSTQVAMSWNVSQGDLQIVAGDPALIPVADYANPQKWPDADALTPVVYNQFSNLDLIAAGGVPPYTFSVNDDPSDPDDGSLPFGTNLVAPTGSINGSPQQVGPGGKPFRVTFVVQDSVGSIATRKLQWEIRTPPIIVATASLPDGRAGTNYNEIIQIADGVPPFAFEWVGDLPSPNDNTDPSWVYAPPAAPTFPSLTGFTVSPTGEASNRVSAADYPALSATGPYAFAPPEGITLGDSGALAGSVSGVPRRMGSFTVIVHVHSTIVPNERGQHGFAQYGFTIADSEPPQAPAPAFEVAPAFLSGLSFDPSDGLPNLPEFAVGVNYNPDLSTHAPGGLLLVAHGGVAQDGFTDAPHLSERTSNPQEVAGRYLVEVPNWDPNGEGWHPGNVPAGRPTGVDLIPAPAGASFSDGVLGTPNLGADLVRQSRQVIRVQFTDLQLPTSTTHVLVQDFGISVGPDVVIVTESTKSAALTTISGTTAEFEQHDDQLLVKRFEVVAGSPTIGPLDDSLLVANHPIPADASPSGTNTLGQLLSRVGAPPPPAAPTMDPHTLDLLRVVVNPAGWWDDAHGLNPKAARHFQHTDANNPRGWLGDGTQQGVSGTVAGFQPTAAAVDLPDAPSVVHSPLSGVYANGGKLYAFDKGTHFGFFVIREDSHIYVPYAALKGTFGGFGDGMILDRGPNTTDDVDSRLRTVQMAVSPDGRFGALKLKVDAADLDELAQNSAVLLFSLTGEKPFGGSAFKIIDTGADGIDVSGVLYSPSMVLTNEFLYFLIGRNEDSTTLASWRDHYVMRYEILGGGVGAGLAPGSGANWTNGLGTPMQSPYQHFSSPTTTTFTFLGPPISMSVQVTVGAGDRYTYDGWNFTENLIAPVPFRVSADGTACGLLSGQTTASTTGTTVWNYFAWVDKGGAGFRQASTVARKARAGAARAHVLRRGSNSYRHWGNYEGPSGAFEISDEGDKIAFVFSTLSSVGSTTSPTSHNLATVRQDVIASETANDWVGFTEHEVTDATFGGTHRWRFGSLTFTEEDKLIFWGGASVKGLGTLDSTTTSSAAYDQWAACMAGTYYLFDFATPTQVQSILPSTDGGTGLNTYTSTTAFNPATTAYTTQKGLIVPVGGFVSRSRDFLYVVSQSPLASNNATALRLIGINLAGTTINGHLADQGFAVQNWPARRGFMPMRLYHPHDPISGRFNAPGLSTASGRQVMAKDTGFVFFASHLQIQGQSQSASTSSFSSGPIHPTTWRDEGTQHGHVEGFHADVGGPIQRITHPGFSDPPNPAFTSTIAQNFRGIGYLEVTRDGRNLAYVFHGANTSSDRLYDQEGVGYAAGIGFDAAGNLLGFNPATDAFVIDGSGGLAGGSLGRAGPSMAHASGGTKLYYAFRAGGSDENTMQLVEAVYQPGTGTVTAGRFFSGARYAVLHAGR